MRPLDFDADIPRSVSEASDEALFWMLSRSDGYGQSHTVAKHAQGGSDRWDAPLLTDALDAAFEDLALLLGLDEEARERAYRLRIGGGTQTQIKVEAYWRIHDRWEQLQTDVGAEELSMILLHHDREIFLDDLRQLLELLHQCDDDGGDGDILSHSARELIGQFKQARPKSTRSAKRASDRRRARAARAEAEYAATRAPKAESPRALARRATRKRWTQRARASQERPAFMPLEGGLPELEVSMPVAYAVLTPGRLLGLDFFPGALAMRARQDLEQFYGLEGFVPLARDLGDTLYGFQGTRFVRVVDGDARPIEAELDDWLEARWNDPPPAVDDDEELAPVEGLPHGPELSDPVFLQQREVFRLPPTYTRLFANGDLGPLAGPTQLHSWDERATLTERLGADRVGPFFPFATGPESSVWAFASWSRFVWRLGEQWESTRLTFAGWFCEAFRDPAHLQRAAEQSSPGHARESHSTGGARGYQLATLLADLLRALIDERLLLLVPDATLDAVLAALEVAVTKEQVASLADLDKWLMAREDVDDVLFSQEELERRAAALLASRG